MALSILAFSYILAQVSASSFTIIIYLVLFGAIFYFLLIRPGQKQRRQHDDLVRSIGKGDEVLTSGGIYGKVTKIADDYVMLEIAKKTEIKVSRASIVSRVTVEAEVDEPGEPPELPEE